MGAEVNTGCAVQFLSNESSKVATRDPLNEGVVKMGVTCVGHSSLLLPACLTLFFGHELVFFLDSKHHQLATQLNKILQPVSN
jgi:hypothetical protein